MPKFKFKSARKNKLNFVTDKLETFESDIIGGIHVEIFSNKKLILEDCLGIIDYKSDYLKLKIKKGFLNILGNELLITTFENKIIIVTGYIVSIEFCV